MNMGNAIYLLRFDDICPTMKWDMWDRVEQLMIKYNIKPIVAVVPNNCDEKLMLDPPREGFWEKVRYWKSIGWTIALHGYSHTYENKNCGIIKVNDYSEFAGVDIDTQRTRIQNGIKIFESNGVKPNVWVAPAHSFDKNTVKVLEECSIKYISDGYSDDVFERYNTCWIPCQLYKFGNRKKGIWTVCKHPNMWSEEDFQNFKNEIETWHEHIVDVEQISKYKHNWFNNFKEICKNNFRCNMIYLKRKFKNLMKGNLLHG